MSSRYQLHSWFTYSMLLLFLSTAGFWVNALHDAEINYVNDRFLTRYLCHSVLSVPFVDGQIK